MASTLCSIALAILALHTMRLTAELDGPHRGTSFAKTVPDSIAFTIAVNRLRQGTDSDVFVVTAIPLAGGEESLDPESLADSTAPGVKELIAARRRVLSSLGIREGAIIPISDCPRAPITEPAPRKCPANETEAVVVGLPRQGGAYVPSGGYDERASGTAAGEWVVRAIVVTAGKFGSNLTGIDVVMKEATGVWKLERLRVLWSGF